MNDYELNRAKRIERNRAFLQQVLSDVPVVSIKGDVSPVPRRAKRRLASTDVRRPATPEKPPRRSRRRQVEQDLPSESAVSDASEEPESGSFDECFDLVSYFARWGGMPDYASRAVAVDGHFRGWVQTDVCRRLGIAENAEHAWSMNGGGTFSFRNPLGVDGEQRKSSTVSKKQTLSARELARKSLLKNPNAYFYRHNEPGEEQWLGDWREEEIERFVEIARTYGCGDKWGLFASYIPHRVGYQCSNAYRDLILPMGLIQDPNYVMTRSGKAVYVGRRTYRKRYPQQ